MVGKQRISPALFPIRADAKSINTAYIRAGVNKTGEIIQPSNKDSDVATTVNGGAK